MENEIVDFESVNQFEPQWCEAVLELIRLATKVDQLFKMFSIA